jgi:hypothetical protein
MTGKELLIEDVRGKGDYDHHKGQHRCQHDRYIDSGPIFFLGRWLRDAEEVDEAGCDVTKQSHAV